MSERVTREALDALVGVASTPTDWMLIDQERIGSFADATEDHQFIHVDPQRAAQTPFGATIAHGFLTLSLLPHLLADVTPVPEGTVMGINYGLNKVRFLQPVVVGSEIRARATVTEIAAKGPQQLLLTTAVTVEIRGQKKPALIAETLTLFVLE